MGDRSYPGFPATAIGVQNDPALHVAFFALSYDQDVNTPISVFATDPAGNTALAAVDHMAFTKPFSRSTIWCDHWHDGFRELGAIVAGRLCTENPTFMGGEL